MVWPSYLVWRPRLEKSATAQPGQELMPDQSAAKAKQVLQQVINALGGQAFLDVHDTDCDGRVAQFGTNEELMGFTEFRDLWLLPDKNRTEYIARSQNTIAGFLMGADGLAITHGGALITVYNGDEGWELDKAGVSDQPDDLVKTFNDQVKSGMNNMLRSRRNEPGVEISYAGTDLIDMKEAEWIEFTDRDHRELRLGVDRLTHLPMRWVVATRDPDTRVRTEITTSYTQYVSSDGVKTPLSVTRMRNDQKVSQTFLTGCKYNSNLQTQLFTSRIPRKQRSAEATKKGYKGSKDSEVKLPASRARPRSDCYRHSLAGVDLAGMRVTVRTAFTSIPRKCVYRAAGQIARVSGAATSDTAQHSNPSRDQRMMLIALRGFDRFAWSPIP